MKTKNVAKIEEAFSVIGFGCWAIGGGDIWNNSNDQDSLKAIQKAVDLGVNFFDVAPVYGLGHAEEILGKGLKGCRDNVLIGSKCGLVWDANKNVTNNLTPKSLYEEIDRSLRRLKTDYIDIYQIHWPDAATPINETMDALNNIKLSGKIRHIGVSNFSAQLTIKAMQSTTIVSHQGLYNMLERNPDSYHGIPLTYETQNEILPLCKENGMAFFPYSPLFQGLLTDGFQANGNFDANDVRSGNPKLNGILFNKYFQIANKLREFAQEIGKPLNQVALNWLSQHDSVTSVICGAQNEMHVKQNVEATSWELTVDMNDQVEQILKPYHNEIFDQKVLNRRSH